MSKPRLLDALKAQGVALNSLAQELFADDRFCPGPVPVALELVELSVADLGFPHGGTMPALCDAARTARLTLCPLETAPHLRLQLVDQPEGHVGFPETRQCAPPGSMTIVSAPIATDDETPTGFYLRRIDGTLWLRGYRSDSRHVWSPEDRLVFCAAPPVPPVATRPDSQAPCW